MWRICSTKSNPLSNHQARYGPMISQLSNITVLITLQQKKRDKQFFRRRPQQYHSWSGQKGTYFFIPEREEDESSEEEAQAEHHKQAITEPLVLGIVSEFGSLWGWIKHRWEWDVAACSRSGTQKRSDRFLPHAYEEWLRESRAPPQSQTCNLLPIYSPRRAGDDG